jgi:hypothetical protein
MKANLRRKSNPYSKNNINIRRRRKRRKRRRKSTTVEASEVKCTSLCVAELNQLWRLHLNLKKLDLKPNRFYRVEEQRSMVEGGWRRHNIIKGMAGVIGLVEKKINKKTKNKLKKERKKEEVE